VLDEVGVPLRLIPLEHRKLVYGISVVRKAGPSDVIVVPISSVRHDAPMHVRLRAREGGLPQPSMAKCEQVTTLRRDRLASQPLGGTLAGARMVEVEKAILRAIGVPVA